MNLTYKLKPDIVKIQYERGLYEIDTSLKHTARRLLYGPTLDNFYKLMNFKSIKELAKRKEVIFAALPTTIRALIRRIVLEIRYELRLEIVHLSQETISLAKTNQELVKRGTVIYHGAEPPPLISAQNKQEY